MSTEKPRRLGRGLEALLATKSIAVAIPAERGSSDSLGSLPIALIHPNPFQPRKEFPADELGELESSLDNNGLLQAITVRRASSGEGYELIAGERRLRAATRLGWTQIPAVVKEIDDRALLTLALIENLQRADLNPIEEGEGYQRLISEFSLTQQEVAEIIGKDRSTVANMLRLLHLPVSIRGMVQRGLLTIGHARALLAASNERAMVELAREIVAKGLTVRDVEQRVRNASSASPATRTPQSAKGLRGIPLTAEVKRLQEELRRQLQTDVTITVDERERGRIEIAFYSADDFERVLDVVLAGRREHI